jgi:hypothetical protein
MVGISSACAARNDASAASSVARAPATIGDDSTATRMIALSSSASGRIAIDALSAFAPIGPFAPTNHPSEYAAASSVSFAARSCVCIVNACTWARSRSDLVTVPADSMSRVNRTSRSASFSPARATAASSRARITS